MKPTAEQIEEAKAKHPDRELMLLESLSYTVIVTIPNGTEIGAFRREVQNVERRSNAMSRLVTNSIVWPDRAAVNEILSTRPLMLENWLKQIEELAGGAEEVTAKKL
jgi:hypothetical protein